MKGKPRPFLKTLVILSPIFCYLEEIQIVLDGVVGEISAVKDF